MGGIYPNNTYLYSFDSFRFLLLGSLDDRYTNIVRDLQSLYLASIDQNRTINNNLYQTALQNYR